MTTNGADHNARLKADVGARRVARVYAEALFNEANARNQSREILDELEALVNDVVRPNPDTEAFFRSAAIGRDRKAEALRAALGGRTSDLVFNFILVLNDHYRLDLLAVIVAAYRELLEQHTGQMRVQVRTAVPLDHDHQERLRHELRQAFAREPILEQRVDPDLLGGLVVQVGDWLYDASVRTRIESIRNQLIERSSYEIQSGRDRFSHL
ncbi:MAG: ATP synthase F1 subunit delta [Planctomycetes bacterium]|nr:ATP synthase F1 subunit delta [Planctomycetota bacterium]